MMRTTLDIDDDVLEAVKELAKREKKSAGAMLSHYAREGILGPRRDPAAAAGGLGEETQAGLVPGLKPWPTFPHREGESRRIITLAHVQRVQDEIDREDAERASNPRR